jgi:deoxyhypusine synthase
MPHDNKTCPKHAQWLSGRSIEPLQLSGNDTVVDMIDNVFAASGFNGRRLAEAAQVFSKMIDADATIAITLAGAMTPIGMSGILSDLIQAGFVDFIISTGANIYHDLHRPFELPMVQGSPDVDDNELADVGVARIYDVFIGDDDTLMATDKVILDSIADFDASKPFSTAALHHALGRVIRNTAPQPQKSFVAKAAEFDVPLYTSSPGDSSLGMNLIVPHMFKGDVNMNPLLDVIETAAIVRDADQNGVVEIGGGSPKNFYLQTQPTLHQILNDSSKGGHDYFIQLTTDSPHWGGLSGATPSEARSWGKLKDAHTNAVVVYSCASLTFPLLAKYVLAKHKPRRHKRLFPRIDEMVETMKTIAKNNPVFKNSYNNMYKFE